eukprot:TRINITY_DN8755_c0_g1_i2.p1 TRINITY_DN8755_c0_g1~~TRINITY_DN8755_c0_g1_i2.p1  ORF type:complete len:423 (+),score=49.11 TRINITY_DN8755_c0_g1_i2:139-1407(+)
MMRVYLILISLGLFACCTNTANITEDSNNLVFELATDGDVIINRNRLSSIILEKRMSRTVDIEGRQLYVGGDGSSQSNPAFSCQQAHDITPMSVMASQEQDQPLALYWALLQFNISNVTNRSAVHTCQVLKDRCLENSTLGRSAMYFCRSTCALLTASSTRWLCEDGDCNRPYPAVCVQHGQSIWEALFSVSPYDTRILAGYNSSFWTDATFAQSPMPTWLDPGKDARFEGYSKARAFTKVGVLVSIGGQSYTSLSTYQVQTQHVGKSLLKLMTSDQDNIQWTSDRRSFQGRPVKPLLRRNTVHSLDLYGDLFTDFTDALAINRRDAWPSAEYVDLDYARLSTMLSNPSDWGAVFAGVGGYEKYPGPYEFEFEYASISAFCGKEGLYYGPARQYQAPAPSLGCGNRSGELLATPISMAIIVQ